MPQIKSLNWNAQSLNNPIKQTQLSHLVESKNIKILLITETWFGTRSSPGFPHFSCYRVDRFHGGVALFIHKSIPHTFYKQISIDCAEAVFVKIHDQPTDITVGAIYCSPAANKAKSEGFFNSILSIGGPVVIAGDFNAKHQLWNNTGFNTRGRLLYKIADSKNFKIHSPDAPTLIPAVGSVSAVDLVLSKNILGVTDPKVEIKLSSDHLPLTFTIPRSSNDLNDLRILNFQKANWRLFKSKMTLETHLINNSLPELGTKENIDNCITDFENSIRTSMENSIPKKLPYKYIYPHSDEIKRLSSQRNFYRKQFLTTQNPAYKSVARQLERIIRAKISEINSQSFCKKVESLKTQNRTLYQFAKCLKKKKTALPPLENPDGSLSYSNQQKANTLAATFHDCHTTTLAMASNQEQNVNKSIISLERSTILMKNSDFVKTGEISDNIRLLKLRKAPGPDKIPNSVLKALPPVSIELLATIFNACLLISYFPRCWKMGKIVAIPKPGKDPCEPKNSRPISLLSNIGKLCERSILDRLQAHARDTNLSRNNQFGFREQHSTIQAVLSAAEKISFNNNKTKSTGMVLLDVEKAFDSCWHDAILHKLRLSKFPLYLIKIIQSYLTDRSAFVEVLGSSSPDFNIPAGVPQGSLLAPLLFNVLTNDIPTPNNCDLISYADDTALLCESTKWNIKLLRKRLIASLEATENYLNSWKIKINSGKTEFIIFSKAQKIHRIKSEFPPVYKGTTFQWKEEVRYLGVTLDSKLLFKSHIDRATKQANANISTLFCLLKKNSTLPKDLKLLIYKLYIRPVLTYAGTVFQNCAKTHFNRLQVLQNKSLRMVLDQPYGTRNVDLHKEAKIPTILEFIEKNAKKFYETTSMVENPLVRQIGAYVDGGLPFRVKHRLPRTIA